MEPSCCLTQCSEDIKAVVLLTEPLRLEERSRCANLAPKYSISHLCVHIYIHIRVYIHVHNFDRTCFCFNFCIYNSVRIWSLQVVNAVYLVSTHQGEFRPSGFEVVGSRGFKVRFVGLG